MKEPRRAQCRSCGDPTLRLTEGKLVVERVLRKGEGRAEDRKHYTSHFATCPEAGEWRQG